MERHLKILEQEAIELIREVITTTNLRNVCGLYSMGKNSCVLHHLINKAFYPRPVNIRFLHIDTGCEFAEMYELRKLFAIDNELVTFSVSVDSNLQADAGYADAIEMRAINEAMSVHNIGIAFSGRCSKEDQASSEQNMVSVRGADPGSDRTEHCPEINKLWNTLLAQNNTLLVFPLSKWTELDIWEYILAEKIEVAPLYFSHSRRVVGKQGLLLPAQSEEGGQRNVRFRKLGYYPLTAAMESAADSVEDIINGLRCKKNTITCW